jgi:hypothetical protein
MSALCQKQTLEQLQSMSPSKADISSMLGDVHYVPKADIMRRSKSYSITSSARASKVMAKGFEAAPAQPVDRAVPAD